MTMRVRARPSSGFTLLEMLVTLVLVALVAGVLGQVMFQLSRVERLLASAQLQGAAQSVRVNWVRGLIEATQPGEPDSPERFSGGERQIRGFSAEVPAFPDNGAERYELRLETAADGSRTSLLLIRPSRGVTSTELTLLDWPGRAGSFAYLDDDGRWEAQWPPNRALPQALPAAVALRTGLEGASVLIAAPRPRAEPLSTRRLLDQL